MKKMSGSTRAGLLIVAGALVLTPALAACGGSSSSSSSSSAAAPSSATPTASESSSAAAGKPVLANGQAPANRTITITKAALTPAELTIEKGQNVTFKAGESGTYAVEVGGLDSATVTGGLIETFDFPYAGEYKVVETISGNTAVIKVK